jgi:hypothetical protein
MLGLISRSTFVVAIFGRWQDENNGRRVAR